MIEDENEHDFRTRKFELSTPNRKTSEYEDEFEDEDDWRGQEASQYSIASAGGSAGSTLSAFSTT